MHNMGVSIADLEARGVAWNQAFRSTNGLQAKLNELESNLTDYQSKIEGVLSTLGAYPTIDLSGFDKFKLLDQTVYDAAKAAVEAALKMHDPGKTQSSEDAALTTAIGDFDLAVTGSLNIVGSDKQTVKNLLRAKTDAIKNAAPP